MTRQLESSARRWHVPRSVHVRNAPQEAVTARESRGARDPRRRGFDSWVPTTKGDPTEGAGCTTQSKEHRTSQRGGF